MKTDKKFFVTRSSFLLKMTNFSEKVVEEIKTHTLCSLTF